VKTARLAKGVIPAEVVPAIRRGTYWRGGPAILPACLRGRRFRVAAMQRLLRAGKTPTPSSDVELANGRPLPDLATRRDHVVLFVRADLGGRICDVEVKRWDAAPERAA
jgi:hypothetical protein